jgi:hypothetical protein
MKYILFKNNAFVLFDRILPTSCSVSVEEIESAGKLDNHKWICYKENGSIDYNATDKVRILLGV